MDVALLTERYPSELTFFRHIDIIAVVEVQCISTVPQVLFPGSLFLHLTL